jgi:predicted type IV restriction endonuclease
MEFKNDMQKLSLQVLERKNHVSNEEMTKQSLIIPFIQKLGYDVFNPLEVRPEFTADFGIKKGEKVDYAIFKNGVPIIFIEAKSVTENLKKHDSQLSRYFNAIPEVRIGILTNGVEYKFFTDLNMNNVMDNTPFFSFSMDNLSGLDIETIENFVRENFDSNEIVKFAEELIYMTNLNSNIKELFKNPPDDFLRFLIKDFSSTRITSNVLDRFRPIVQKAINNTLLEIISEGLSPKIVEVTVANDEEENVELNEKLTSKVGIVTTEEELQSFEIIKTILSENGRNIEELKYKDTLNYFNVMNRVITKWFIRVNLDQTVKYIYTRLEQEVVKELCTGFEVVEGIKSTCNSRVIIQNINDLLKMEKLIVACFDQVAENSPVHK